MNLFDYKEPKEDEDFTTLFANEKVKIVRIVSGTLQAAKEFCDSEDEWVVLLKGKAKLQIETKIISMQEGDTLFIPANTPHKLLEVSKGALWLAVHMKV